jgi:Uncharacterized protein conserved in bacteria
MSKTMIRVFVCCLMLVGFSAQAAEFRAVDKTAVMFDAPSQKARALFIYGAGVPVEIVSSIEGWSKVRDAQGTVGWLEHDALGNQRMLQVRQHAEVRAQPTDSAALVFEAEQDVLLHLDENATSATKTLTPGWVRVRHEGGQVGYVRIDRIFGL